MKESTLIEQAENLVRQRAARHAYTQSDKLMNSEVQKFVFALVRESIILGARMMHEAIEELTNEKK